MDSFEWNKIFMGLGFSALAVFGINELTKAIYHVEKPTESAYVVQGVEEASSAGGSTAGAELALPDFGTVLASADVAAGEKIAGKCAQCHTWEKGGANKIGPNLYGVVGNHHAHLGDAFAYSPAMLALKDEKWDYEHLYRFLENPAKVIKGTKMAFAGLKKSEDRVNLIAFLRTQADSPAPLPPPNPAGAAPEGAAPADGKPAEGGAKPAEPAAPAPEGEKPAAAAPDAKPAEPTPPPAAPEGGKPAEPAPAAPLTPNEANPSVPPEGGATPPTDGSAPPVEGSVPPTPPPAAPAPAPAEPAPAPAEPAPAQPH